VGRGHVTPQLINVLSQIAFTYFLTYFIMQWKWRYQVITAIALLAFWTALLVAFPGPDRPFSKTGSVGLVVDRAIFHYDYDPAYSTLNFIPSTLWTLSGVWAGRLLMAGRSHAATLRALAGGMALSFALWLALRSWIPMIKQLCTPTFIFYSLGWVLLMLIGFYWFVEIHGYKRVVFPLVVVGMNSIFIYSVGELLHGWLDRAVGVFTFRFEFLGAVGHIAQACAVVLVLWYLCYRLYQRKIFIKV
jgi:predicted acyltransferase